MGSGADVEEVAVAAVADAPAPFAAATGHGGRLSAAMAAYPNAPRPWIDLSTGINPEPWRGLRASVAELSRLPDPAGLAELEAAAARAFGVADPARVVATAGAEAGLRLLPMLMRATDVDIVSPTYAGHEAAWRAHGARVQAITRGGLSTSTADAAVVVNPNNPDGATIARDDLAAAVEGRSAKGRWTIVDESFVEVAPELSVADVTAERLVVLRSFGKFYGLAGLRLGFVIAAPAVAARLRTLQGEWPVSAEAIAMGTEAYADAGWRATTQADLARRAGELDELLASSGLTVRGGTSLFRLVEARDAAAVFQALCEAGILTRPFADQTDLLRVGLPRLEDVSRLVFALLRLPR